MCAGVTDADSKLTIDGRTTIDNFKTTRKGEGVTGGRTILDLSMMRGWSPGVRCKMAPVQNGPSRSLLHYAQRSPLVQFGILNM